MLSYAISDLFRNPRRTLASAAGVALAVAMVASIAFFVDASASQMTARAIAPVTIDMQVLPANPLASTLNLTEAFEPTGALLAGQPVTVSLVLANGGANPSTGVLLRDEVQAPLGYVPGSTIVNGTAVADGGDFPLAGGLSLPNLPPGARVTVTYRAAAASAVPSLVAVAFHGSVTSAQDPAPVPANTPAPVQLTDLTTRVAAVPGVATADRLGTADLPAGSLGGAGKTISLPIRVFGFDPAYLTHFSLVRLTAGTYAANSVLLSPDAARSLGANPGSRVRLAIPGRAVPLDLAVGGIADFSAADALFASRSPDNQGEFIQVPNVVVVPFGTFQDQVMPALRVDAAAPIPVLRSPPTLEVDVRLDRGRLATDPTVAAVTTQGLKRSIERLAPGQLSVIDNLSEALNGAKGDTILAKILFLFLGLPGALLAAYLSRYAASLLAQAQRREQATLRARGAQPRHLLAGLAYTTAGVAITGSILGLLLAVLTVGAVLGPTALQRASQTSLGISVLLALAVGLLTTALALYLPGRRSLLREATEERREIEAPAGDPGWMRARLDLALIAAAALVWIITLLSGGFKTTPAEGQSVSLSFYTLLAPLLGWLGVTLFGVRVLLMAIPRLLPPRPGPYGRLVPGTLQRSIGLRSRALSSGVAAVALAVAFGVSLSLFVATYEAEKQADARFVVGSDLRVTPSALSPQVNTFATQLRVRGASSVSPVAQTSSALVGSDKRALAAIDPVGFPEVATLPDSFFSGLSASDAMSLMRRDPAAVLVSTELARSFNIQPGDEVRIQLTTSAGRPAPVTLHAIGVFNNFPGFPQGIDLVANLALYQSATSRPQDDFFLVKAADPTPAGVGALAAVLKTGPGRSVPLLVQTTSTAINRDQSTLASLSLRGLGSLEAVYTVLISAAGIAIFVFGLLLQRRKEYVTMRALGIRLSQLRLLVLSEAAVVAVCSLVLGGAVGTAMALMFVQILRPLFTIAPSTLTVPAGQLGLLATLVLAGLALSVLLAARNLRRLRPVELLREE